VFVQSGVCVCRVAICCRFMLCMEHGVFMLPLQVVRTVWESTRTSRDSCEDQVRSSQSTLRGGGVRGAGQYGGASRPAERASGSCAVAGRVVRIMGAKAGMEA
jgi:hypothetical protein